MSLLNHLNNCCNHKWHSGNQTLSSQPVWLHKDQLPSAFSLPLVEVKDSYFYTKQFMIWYTSDSWCCFISRETQQHQRDKRNSRCVFDGIMTPLTSANGASHKLLCQTQLVFVPCAGSSVWEAGCLESFSWLWVAARWSTAALRPPSLWPWYPETRYPPGHSEKRQSTSRRDALV